MYACVWAQPDDLNSLHSKSTNEKERDDVMLVHQSSFDGFRWIGDTVMKELLDLLFKFEHCLQII